MIKELYYVTGNRGKFEMVKNFLASHTELSVKNIDLDLLEEQTLDLKQIAISKAEQAWSKVGKPLIVDDSGIFFKRYNQFPGVMTKFIFKSLGMEGLFRLYDEGDSATFVTYLCFKMDDEKTRVFEGSVKGTLIKPTTTQIDMNLPYTHILVPNGTTQTLHELTQGAGYSEYNPRIIALQKLVEFLRHK
ncbi:hypothetical protein Noda2021_01670 [Candidatus Dependentiae bacterium Noda2021]|nr:hypothetical protein Noda2021_01670 [Candidatus Dependentiae bacterium Noda2021]